MKVLLAHPGTQHAFRLARELDHRGLLGEFWTGLALADGSIGAKVAGMARGWPVIGGLHSRVAHGIDRARIHTLPGIEIKALLGLRLGGEKLSILHERNRRFQAAIPDDVLRRSDAIVGFDTSSWLLAQRAHTFGRPLLLDRSIACASAVAPLFEKLHQQYPAWLATAEARPAWLVAAERQEHALADRIVVGGSFARDSLVAEGADAAKIRLNPYGVDWARFAAAAAATGPAPGGGRPLRFLFVGSLIGRKGLPVLIDAWRRLQPCDAELWLAGACGVHERPLIPELPGLRQLGRVPHADVPRLYGQADVFVLPSLLEGFSLVMLEALASGLPIIVTPNTGGADLLASDELGRLIEPGSVGALAEALHHYLEHPPRREDVAAAAATLRARFSWAAYGDRWARLLQEDLSRP